MYCCYGNVSRRRGNPFFSLQYDYQGGRTQDELVKYVEDRVAGKPIEEVQPEEIDPDNLPPEGEAPEGEEEETVEEDEEPPKDEL